MSQLTPVSTRASSLAWFSACWNGKDDEALAFRPRIPGGSLARNSAQDNMYHYCAGD